MLTNLPTIMKYKGSKNKLRIALASPGAEIIEF